MFVHASVTTGGAVSETCACSSQAHHAATYASSPQGMPCHGVLLHAYNNACRPPPVSDRPRHHANVQRVCVAAVARSGSGVAVVALPRSHCRVSSTLVHVSCQEGILILAPTHHLSPLTAVSVGVIDPQPGVLRYILPLKSLSRAGCAGAFSVDACTCTVSAQTHCLSATLARVRSVGKQDSRPRLALCHRCYMHTM